MGGPLYDLQAVLHGGHATETLAAYALQAALFILNTCCEQMSAQSLGGSGFQGVYHQKRFSAESVRAHLDLLKAQAPPVPGL